jgi:SAM-dependent methyltransferase
MTVLIVVVLILLILILFDYVSDCFYLYLATALTAVVLIDNYNSNDQANISNGDQTIKDNQTKISYRTENVLGGIEENQDELDESKKTNDHESKDHRDNESKDHRDNESKDHRDNESKDHRDNESKQRQWSFENIYKKGIWQDNKDTPLSGNGSSIAVTTETRRIMKRIIRDYNIKSIVDAGCGDITWIPVLLKELADEGIEITYTGCDITKFLIEKHKEKYKHHKNMSFLHLDLANGKLPKGDLVLCRDAIQHLLVKDGIKALKNISDSGSKYLLATTYIRQTPEKNTQDLKRTGYCISRDLMRKPYNLHDAIALFSEKNNEYHKYLGLWELPIIFKEIEQKD